MLTYADLKPKQRGAIDFLQARSAALLWADVGTGKTVCTITAICNLLASFDCKRVLVIAPKRVAGRVWRDEVEAWAHTQGLRVSRIIGTPAERLAAMQVDADIYTLTRDNVQWLEKQFIETTRHPITDKLISRKQIRKWIWDTVVLDESQSFKSQSSQRFKSLRMLRQLIPRLYLLSASVMPNGYKDLWSQLYLLDGGQRLGNSEKAFHQRWFHKEVYEGVVTLELRKGAAEEIMRAISDITYVMEDEQPPVPKNFIRVTLTKTERKAYDDMVRTSVLRFSDKVITAVNAGVLYGKLLQIANGAIYHDAEHNWTLVHDQKLEALWELLEELPKPVLIGYGFVHDLQRIQAAGNETGLGKFAVLKSDKSLDAWRRGEIDYGIIHPASAGHGLNDLYVSGSENIVWFGFTNNLEFYQQLNGRITGGHRRTGRSPVIHHIMADDTIDEDAKALLEQKDSDQTKAKIGLAARLKEKFSETGKLPHTPTVERSTQPADRAPRRADHRLSSSSKCADADDRDGLDWLSISPAVPRLGGVSRNAG